MSIRYGLNPMPLQMIRPNPHEKSLTNIDKHTYIAMTVPKNGQGIEAPPAYGDTQGPTLETGEDALPTHFGDLKLSDSALSLPDVDSCLAHLRLLFVFQKLKTRIGLHDGLWDIYDSRSASASKPLDLLVTIREKRWAIYVARAVDRFEAWWKSFVPDVLREDDMLKTSQAGQKRYADFPESQPSSWTPEMLPPIGKSVHVSAS